jgi:hypothetical protein
MFNIYTCLACCLYILDNDRNFPVCLSEEQGTSGPRHSLTICGIAVFIVCNHTHPLYTNRVILELAKENSNKMTGKICVLSNHTIGRVPFEKTICLSPLRAPPTLRTFGWVGGDSVTVWWWHRFPEVLSRTCWVELVQPSTSGNLMFLGLLTTPWWAPHHNQPQQRRHGVKSRNDWWHRLSLRSDSQM